MELDHTAQERIAVADVETMVHVTLALVEGARTADLKDSASTPPTAVARFLVAGSLGGLLRALAPAASRWPAPPFGRVIVQGFQTAWVIPAHGAVVTLAGAESVDSSRRLGSSR